jgi:acetyltransferase-like isoleucine patch superfamily enzyme
MTKIGIFGTSGFAREVGDIALALGFEPIYVARDQLDADCLNSDEDVVLERIRAIDGKVGVTVCSGVRLTNNIKVGSFTIFNLNTTVGHDSIIEDFVNISPGANISGNTHIETGCWIGTGATINQGDPNQKMRIGCDTMIGSGSVVVKPCESGATYVGIPAKRIK